MSNRYANIEFNNANNKDLNEVILYAEISTSSKSAPLRAFYDLELTKPAEYQFVRDNVNRVLIADSVNTSEEFGSYYKPFMIADLPNGTGDTSYKPALTFNCMYDSYEGGFTVYVCEIEVG